MTLIVRNRFPDQDDGEEAIVKPKKFDRPFLSFDDMRLGAQELLKQIRRSDNQFVPSLVVALNEGGLATSVILNFSRFRVPLGPLFTAKKGSTRHIDYASLPIRSSGLEVKSILIVDTKLKTGSNLAVARDYLHVRYPEAEMVYAIVLAYGGWSPSKWLAISGRDWPVQSVPEGFRSYVAFYTDSPVHQDPIEEEFRSWVSQAGPWRTLET